MIANMNEKGRQTKLLAAVAVFAMVVCTLAVVMPSDDVNAVPVTPTEEDNPFAGVEGLTYDAETGVYTATPDVTIALDADTNYGTATNPLNVRFDLTAGSITFSSEVPKTIYINYVAEANTEQTNAEKSVFYGSDDGTADITVGQNVTIDAEISVSGNGENSNNHVFTRTDLVLSAGTAATTDTAAIPGGAVIISQASSVNGVSIWGGSINAESGSTITLDAANGIHNSVTITMNSATMNVVNPNVSTISPGEGSSITNSTITCDSTETTYGGFWFGNNITIGGTEMDLGGAELRISEGVSVTANAQTAIDASQIQIIPTDDDSDTVTITGGTINADVTTYPGYDAGAITFSEVTVDTMTVMSGVTATLGENVTVDGTLVNDGEIIIENAIDGQITAGEGTVSSTNAYLLSYAENGSLVSSDGELYTVYTHINGAITSIFGVKPEYYNGEDYAGRGQGTIELLGAYNTTGAEPQELNDATLTTSTITIYELESDADDETGVYGDAINAGNYYIRADLSVVYISENNRPQTYNPVFTAVFKVLPYEVTDGEIRGNGENGAITSQPYGEDGVTLTAGEDFNVYVDTDSNTPLIPGTDYDYEVMYTPGEAQATLVVTLKNNYTSAEPLEKPFDVIQTYTGLEITDSHEGSYYVGESIDTSTLTVDALRQDGTRVQDITGYTISIVGNDYTDDALSNVLNNGGEIQVIVTYTYGDDNEFETSGQFTVQVIDIESVEVANIDDGTPFKTEYELEESIDSNGMQVTVTYTDGATAIFENAIESGDAQDAGFSMTGGTLDGEVTLSTYVTFDPATFDNQVGEVEVSVIYFSNAGTITVNVNGYAVNYIYYVDGVEQPYGTQVGKADDVAVIYNFAMTSPVQGQSFTGWMLQGTSSVYQAGSAIRFGEDSNMWGENKTITLVAQFGTSGTIPDQPGETDPATQVLIFIGSSTNGVNVMVYGVDGYVPAGTSVTVTYTVLTYVPELDRYFNDTITTEAVVIENADGLSAILLSFNLPEGSTVTGAYASYVIEGGQPVNSDSIAISTATA